MQQFVEPNHSAFLISANEKIDDVSTTLQHRELIRSKTFLRAIYQEHYDFFKQECQRAPLGPVIELGSGGGFLSEIMPEVIASDVVALPDLSLVCSAQAFPFRSSALAAILMINVLHHLQDVASFFNEASRCLLPGGRIVMIEPACTLFSSFIYRNFHHEPFEPNQSDWPLPPGGRMSSANDALPWIIFFRDRARFEQYHSELRIDRVEVFMPFRYLVSGGVSKPQLLPSWSYKAFRKFELLLKPLNGILGMFMKVTLTKT